MERLTYRAGNEVRFRAESGEAVVRRLADYEDLGITPEQMQEIDKLYAEKCRELAECQKQALPCKIGDVAWAVRDYMGILGVKKGIVSEMFYNRDMELIVVVKNIARGKIGEKVFLSEAEAEQAVQKGK